MTKQSGAFLTIGELSAELNVPQHVLRYWETRFPALRPLQRAGNRRYYRPADVELARRIHRLLSVEGYTVRGAQQALAGTGSQRKIAGSGETVPALPPTDSPDPVSRSDGDVLARLSAIRATLIAALD